MGAQAKHSAFKQLYEASELLSDASEAVSAAYREASRAIAPMASVVEHADELQECVGHLAGILQLATSLEQYAGDHAAQMHHLSERLATTRLFLNHLTGRLREDSRDVRDDLQRCIAAIYHCAESARRASTALRAPSTDTPFPRTA